MTSFKILIKIKIIKLIIFLFIIINFFNGKLFGIDKDIIGFDLKMGIHLFDFNSINKFLIDENYPELMNSSILSGINFKFNFFEFKDTSKNYSFLNDFKSNIYTSVGYTFNIPIPSEIKNNKSSLLNYNMLNIEKYFPIKLVNYLSINPSIGINYSWGNLTLADSVYSSILVESYLTNPPIIYEFSIKRIALNFGLGININLLEHEVINENRTIKYFYTINLNTNFLLPIHYDFLSGPNDKDYLRNSAGQAIYGLSTDFPYGFIFGIRLGFDKVTTY